MEGLREQLEAAIRESRRYRRVPRVNVGGDVMDALDEVASICESECEKYAYDSRIEWTGPGCKTLDVYAWVPGHPERGVTWRIEVTGA